jgi:hypothetical protein
VKFNGRSAWAEWLGVLLKLEASMKKLLVETAHRADHYVTGIANRPVVPLPADVARLEALGLNHGEELAIVAYLKTLSDGYMPKK